MLVLLPSSKIRRPLLLAGLFILFFPAMVSAQYLFLQKIYACSSTGYCMDCGTPKATCEPYTLNLICENISRKYMLKSAYGTITFQVLVEASGFSCVLSHNDPTNSALTTDLIRALNGCLWKPAIVNGKAVDASVNVIFRLGAGTITADMDRMDLDELAPPGDPFIFNTQAVYTNPTLKNYELTTWTKYNSPLPDNVSQSSALDQSDNLWYATAHGLTRFNGAAFDPVNEYNSPFSSQSAVRDVVVDKENNKWVYMGDKIYRDNDLGWQVYDFKNFISAGVTRILRSRNGELLFTTHNGLVVVRKDKVVVLNRKNIPALPSNNVLYAYADAQKRLWIGTSKGTTLIERGFMTTTFNASRTPLKNACISNAVEDEQGNLYFSLLNCTSKAGDDDAEGIAVLTPKGKWLHYTDKNSGLPSNRVNTMLYDKFTHALWIGTDQSGIVRYDMKDGWENYNNKNSAVPGYKILQLLQDSKGDIYATTANGLLRIRKKIGV